MTPERDDPVEATSPRAYVDLFGAVAVRKSRGAGWQVGRPALRLREGRPAHELRGISYYPTARLAAVMALSRVRLLPEGDLPGTKADGPESETAALAAALTSTLLRSVPEILRAARIGAGLSQSELARRAGVSRSTISRVESRDRRPSYEMIHRILRSLP